MRKGAGIVRTVFVLVISMALSACAGTAVVKQVENTDFCGKGTARLIPTETDVWLVLCEDGRVTWMLEEPTP